MEHQRTTTALTSNLPSGQPGPSPLGLSRYTAPLKLETQLVSTLAEKFPEAFRNGNMDHKQAPEIMNELRANFPFMFDQSFKIGAEQTQAILEAIRKEDPAAFPNGRVDWQMVVFLFAARNAANEALVNKFLEQFEKRFPESFPVSKMDDQRLTEIMAVLQVSFPFVFRLGFPMDAHWAESMLKQMRDAHPEAFPRGKVDWPALVRNLFLLNEVQLGLIEDYKQQLAGKFPGTFPVSKVGDPQAPAILEEFRSKYPNLFGQVGNMDAQKTRNTLDSMKRDLPSAFPNGKVNWGMIVPQLKHMNDQVEHQHQYFEDELNRLFPDPPAISEMNSKQGKEITSQLRQFFPDAFFYGEISSSQAQSLLEKVARRFPQAFPNGKPNWNKLVRPLNNLHRQIEHTIKVKVESVIAQLQDKFPDAIPTSKRDDSHVQEILNSLRGHFPDAFFGGKVATSRQAQSILKQIQLDIPKAFQRGNVNWRMVARYLHNHNEESAELKRNFPDAVRPNGMVDVEKVMRAMDAEDPLTRWKRSIRRHIDNPQIEYAGPQHDSDYRTDKAAAL